ncbi:MAG: pyridoxamine 5'-phosphate oxidase family protein [Proteobacteria bacterium]|nr:pyridoxamine 5'-phosphate oxidase family protein [Pseudomonadota bacterium]
MNYKKYLFVFSSALLFSYSTNYIHAANGDIIVQGGTVFHPLESFTPQLQTDIQEYNSPVAVWQEFQNRLDAAGAFKPVGPVSVGSLTTIDPLTNFIFTRAVGVTPQPDSHSFYLHTNPNSPKMKHLQASNNVGLYQAWHTPQKSYQIALSGTISHKADVGDINVPLPDRSNYNSQWHRYEFLPNRADVTVLTHYHHNNVGYCVVEGMQYTKEPTGAWKVKLKPLYIGRNSYKFSPEELANIKKAEKF